MSLIKLPKTEPNAVRSVEQLAARRRCIPEIEDRGVFHALSHSIFPAVAKAALKE